MFEKRHVNELPVPPDASADKKANEIFRAWTVNGGLQVSLVKAFDDPSIWGLLLTDVARHAARIYATEGACSEDEAMAKIRSMWNGELDSPTDVGTTGSVH